MFKSIILNFTCIRDPSALVVDISGGNTKMEHTLHIRRIRLLRTEQKDAMGVHNVFV